MSVKSSRSARPPIVREVETAGGVGRLHRYAAVGAREATLVLGHGAGGGIDARDLQALARALPTSGIEVVLVEQPWVVAGKKIAPAPARLDAAWIPLVAAARRRGTPLIVGGRSAGARVACRTAEQVSAVAILLLAFPLHPPGRPDRSRVDELIGAGLPTAALQGTRDSFGTAAELKRAVARRKRVAVVPISDADHGFKVAAAAASTTERALEQLIAAAERESVGLLRR